MIRASDIVLATILIIILSPVIVFGLTLSSVFIGFPPFFVSARKGKGGKTFRHVKVRSMLPGKELGRVFFELDRLNWCGKFLRRFHLDELTELFHILTGTMSFVGPRPLMLQALEPIDPSIRETVPPGLTGTAQVWLLKKGFLSKELQVRLDNYYVKRRSLWYHFKIMAATLRYLVWGRTVDLAPDSTEARRLFRQNNYRYKK